MWMGVLMSSLVPLVLLISVLVAATRLAPIGGAGGARKNEGAYGPRRLPALACERARHFPRWNKWHRSTQLQPLRSTHVVAIVGLQHRRILSELRVADRGADRIARDWFRFIACTGGWRMAADGIPSAHARRLQHASNPLDWNARAKVWKRKAERGLRMPTAALL